MKLLILALLLSVSTSFDPLINSKATPETKSLYQWLISNYGSSILSGQTTFNYDDFVKKVGKNPLLRGFDMQNYSPHNPWYNWQPTDDGTVAKAIQWYHSTQGKGIVTFFWHWFSPKGGQLRTSTFYTNYTDFDVSRAVIQGSEEYNLTLRDIDAIALQLNRLSAERIPLLWRPLHEAGGGWFWWGARSSGPALSLYRIIYDRLTHFHGLNNLIWVWSTPETEWYPGNARVDMLGYDSYPGAGNYTCRESVYVSLRTIVLQKKMIVLTENGPIPQFDSCKEIRWGLFMGWNDLVFTENSMEHISAVYNLPYMRTLQNT